MNNLQKFTAKELARTLASDIRPAIEAAFRVHGLGLSTEASLRDLFDSISAEFAKLKNHVIVSPYSNVSDDAWSEAYEEAAERIYEKEGADREPTFEEIDRMLETRHERSQDEHAKELGIGA